MVAEELRRASATAGDALDAPARIAIRTF